MGAVRRREENTLIVAREDGAELALDPKRLSGFDAGLTKEIGVAIGDRLLIRANLKPACLKNGDTVIVSGFTPEGGIACTDGRVLPGSFRQFSHGYASTSHASQGKTVDHSILLLGDEGIAAANLKQAYVSNSRFRISQIIYTTDKAAAIAAMERPGQRKLALELIPAPKPQSRWRRFLSARIFSRRSSPVHAASAV